MRKPRTDIDVQLSAAVNRRSDLIDLLWQCLIDIDTVTKRIDVLLKRRFDGEGIDAVDQMT